MRRRTATRLATALALGLLLATTPGCMTGRNPDGSVDPDPLEGLNRPLFSFNRAIDEWIVEPLATVWSWVTPKVVRVAFDRFFVNLHFPKRFFANLGQGELGHAGAEGARFLINTTVGFAGFLDPAGAMGIGFYDEDFGQMFGRWGIPPGAYWMVPIVGPSGPRDLVGYVFDTALNLLPSVGAPLKLVNSRAIAGPQVDLAREASLDYYAFVRDAHLQRRRVLVADLDRAPAGEGEEGPVDEAARREENLLYEVEIDEETSSGE